MKRISIILILSLMTALIHVQPVSAKSVGFLYMHRLYNQSSGEHFYTAKEKERDFLVKAGWKYEGIGWIAPQTSDQPVYRLYNANSGDHHYTMKAKEKDALVKIGWKYEGIGWYSDDDKSVPVYREYNPNMFSCNHNYTTNKKEHAALTGKLGWKDEGIGWYGITPRTETTDPKKVSTASDWEKLMKLPTVSEIKACNKAKENRSPYLAAWINYSDCKQFKEYYVRFKADYLPCGTYCCLGNFDLDYSSLLKKYKSVKTEYSGVAGYAGFQSLEDGRRAAIMSFWDVTCTDASGKTTVLRPKVIYPKGAGEEFGGEGTGAKCIVDYEWEAGHWYSMCLRTGVNKATGNTTIEQWVMDVETEKWTHLCTYDMGTVDVCFKGNIAVFLENFLNQYSGEVRSLEFRRAAIIGVDGKTYWLKKGSFSADYDYPGSYHYAVEGDTFKMITTGVKHKADPPQEKELLSCE